MAERVVFHLGAQTSRSWLARNYLDRYARLLRRQAVAAVPAAALDGTVGWGQKLVRDPGALRAVLAHEFEQAAVVMASHDTTLGRPFDDEGRGLYADVDAVLEALAAALEPWAATVVLTVCPVDTFLEARYLRAVRAGTVLTFADWLARLDLTTLAWRPLHDRLVAVFGADRVRVLDEGRLPDGRSALVTELFRLADVRVPFAAGEPLLREAVMSERGLAITLAANAHLSHAAERAALQEFVLAHFSDLEYPPPRLLPDERAAAIRGDYAHDYLRVTGGHR